MTFRKKTAGNQEAVAAAVVNAAYNVHRAIGPGLLETVYEVVLAHELKKHRFKVERQVAVPIQYKGVQFDEGFRADLIVENEILIELKSCEKVSPAHKKQVLTYLRMTGLKAGFLINFGEELFRQGVHRIVNHVPETR